NLLVQRLPFGTDSLNASLFLLGTQRLIFTHGGNGTLDAATQHNVGTTTGHIGGDRDVTRLASLSHDIGLASMLLGVQNLVLDAGSVQARGNQLGVLDAGGSHQYRLTAFVTVLNIFQNGIELLVIGFENLIVLIFTRQR